MKIKFVLVIVVVFFRCFSLLEAQASAHSDPKLEVTERALLQQLKPEIIASLNMIFKEKYSKFDQEQILSINERVTANMKSEKARPVDAIHGTQYFEIKISLCRPDGRTVEMDLRNDTIDARYHLVGYRIY
ncbi:hypothetical protein ABDI30_15285 [Paenibacillus cisolokensis]|uniref:hypothetical protein n=1 Tax=Paenibacillus cisolokensis TaxID=1658519 RepID=UPI003D2E3BC8